MVPFLVSKSIGMALALALGVTPPPTSPPPDGLGSGAVDNVLPGQDGPRAGDEAATEAAAAPDIPPPETWVTHQFAGVSVRAPEAPADILEEDDYIEFVLWEPDDPDLYLVLGVGLNDESYDDLLDGLENENYEVSELGLVEIGARSFHEIRVRDPAAEIPYLDRAYYAAEPDAEGLYLEVYGFASLPEAESYDWVLRSFLESVQAAAPDSTAPSTPENTSEITPETPGAGPSGATGKPGAASQGTDMASVAPAGPAGTTGKPGAATHATDVAPSATAGPATAGPAGATGKPGAGGQETQGSTAAVSSYTLGGVTIDIPADWPVITEDDDELAVGFMDESGEAPEGVAAGFMLSRDTLEQFTADAANDGITVLEGPPTTIEGQMFRSFEADMAMGPMTGRMQGLVSAALNADGQYVAVMTTVMGRPWADYAEALEGVLASTRLAEDASFGASAPDTATPEMVTPDAVTPDTITPDTVSPADRAAEALARGQTLQAEGDYVGALMAYRESLAVAPSDDLAARVRSLERYLKVKGIPVPPAE